jgi:hypothetical protein
MSPMVGTSARASGRSGSFAAGVEGGGGGADVLAAATTVGVAAVVGVAVAVGVAVCGAAVVTDGLGTAVGDSVAWAGTGVAAV